MEQYYHKMLLLGTPEGEKENYAEIERLLYVIHLDMNMNDPHPKNCAN